VLVHTAVRVMPLHNPHEAEFVALWNALLKQERPP
jgi:hypothetical protein